MAAEAVFLSGLLLGSLWDRRSGTRGLDGPDGLRSPGSLQNTSSINIFVNCVHFESSNKQTNISFIDGEYVKTNMVPPKYSFGVNPNPFILINFMARVSVNPHLIILFINITLVLLMTPSSCSFQQLC